MDSKSNICSLPTELHTQILEYLSDDFVSQIVSSLMLPIWGDIIRDSSRIQRSRYIRFHSAWQNAVAIHRAIGETSERFAICCTVRNKKIENYSLAWKLRNLSETTEDNGMLSSMGDMSHSWSEINITDSFVLDEHFILPFRGPLAQDLKFPDEDVSVSKSHVDSDLRTTFLTVYARRYVSPEYGNIVMSMSIFPSHLKDMTLRSLLKHIVRNVDKALWNRGIEIQKTHYVKIWSDHRGLQAMAYIS
ncbi:hypothetical protein TWF718_000110 [Orbilia javanica]|uniref:F-box domain-containing protein n=1 Tax=Orbilia javanica TaxID=47235 RepID=A0AAN8MTF2_9PEZI